MLVTESELRNIIKESVIKTLNERVNYAMDWENLSEPEKDAIAKKYDYWHATKIYKYPDGTTGTTPTKYNQADPNNPIQGQETYNYDKAKEVYNRKRDRKDKNGNLSYSTDQYSALQKQLNDTKTSLSQAQNLNNGYKAAIEQISQALSRQIKENAGAAVPPPIDSSWQGAPGNTAPTPEQNAAINAKSAVPNLDQLLTTITTLQKQAGMVKGLQMQIETLTAQLQQSQQPAAQPTQQPAAQVRPANPQLAQVNKPMVQNPTAITPPTQQMAKA